MGSYSLEKKKSLDKFGGAKILVACNNQQYIKELKQILKPFNFRIFSSETMKESENYIETIKFDLIFIDIASKKTNGFNIAKMAKDSKFNRTTGIIFIVKNTHSENYKIKCYKLSSISHIETPFHAGEIKAIVYGLLETRNLQIAIIKEKENFIQTLTHDLKTPIAAQICACKLLFNNSYGELSESKKEIARELFASNKFMMLMVQNVLAKYKYENNLTKIIKKKENLTHDIKDIINDLKYIFENKNIKINFYCNKDIELEYDKIEILRVLHNLFSNAVEHSLDNSLIETELKLEDNYASFSISNFSSDFPTENLNIMFEKFVTSAKRYGKIGFGLGLYICKEIIEAHRGKIFAYVDCAKNNMKKITFKFSLPMQTSRNQALV